MNLCGTLPLHVIVGLIHHSRGYIGRDTGPMHLAAALGKPVIGLFGGGHWPRFTPAATPSWVGVVNVPCKGCGWNCPFDESYCIKQIPAKAVRSAIDELEAGRLRGRVVHEIHPSKNLSQSLIHQAMVQISSKTFENSKAAAGQPLEKKLTAGIQELKSRGVELERKIQEQQQQFAQASQQIERNNQLIAQLQSSHDRFVSEQKHGVEVEAQLQTARQELAAAQARDEKLQEQLRAAQWQLDAAGEELASKEVLATKVGQERDEMKKQLQDADAALRLSALAGQSPPLAMVRPARRSHAGDAPGRPALAANLHRHADL